MKSTKESLWTILGEPFKKEGQNFVKVFCRCSPETVHERSLHAVKYKGSLSCGCLKRLATTSRNRSNRKYVVKVGDIYGRLTVVNVSTNAANLTVVDMICTCGKPVRQQPSSLVYGVVKSCGCLRSEMVSVKNTTHGLTYSKAKLYSLWSSMLARCYNKDCKTYHRYGGRGIKVSDSWKNFENFANDMGDRPDGKSLDRVDNDGNYTKENCRWATQAEQSRNTSRNLVFDYKGKRTVLKDIAHAENLSYTKLLYHVSDKGKTLNEAISYIRAKSRLQP